MPLPEQRVVTCLMDADDTDRLFAICANSKAAVRVARRFHPDQSVELVTTEYGDLVIEVDGVWHYYVDHWTVLER